MADLAAAIRQAEEALARIKRHTEADSVTGCHVWTGSRTGRDYGSTRLNGKNVRAHRAVWTLTNGPIPEGSWVLHRCDRPLCVNIDHLFLGDATANVRDAAAKGRCAGQKKTRCPKGHALAGDNVQRDKRGWRHCVECQRAISALSNRRREYRDRSNQRRRERRALDFVYLEKERALARRRYALKTKGMA